MRRLDDILENINSSIAQNLKLPKVVYYREAALQQKDDKTFPMVSGGNRKGTQISPNSNIALQAYHRVLSSETETDYSRGKGRYPYKMRTYTIKMVWIGSIAKLQTKSYETNDDVKNDVYAAFPTVLKNKELVRSVNENINKTDILSDEFSGNQINHLNLDLIIFTIDYEIKQNIKCNG